MDLNEDVALITLEEAKEYLKIADASTGDDEIIQTLINDTSDWVARYLDRDLIEAERTEFYNGDGAVELLLRCSPIVSIGSINIDSTRQFGTESLIEASDYIVNKRQGIVKATDLLGSWTYGDGNIKVVYTAGYDVEETMPHAIRLAVKRILDKQYRLGYSSRKLDTQSESMQGMNITFKDEAIPKDVLTMLDPFKSWGGSPQFSHAS